MAPVVSDHGFSVPSDMDLTLVKPTLKSSLPENSRSGVQLPPLESPPQVQAGVTPSSQVLSRFYEDGQIPAATPDSVDKLVVAGLLDIVKSIDALGLSTTAESPSDGKQESIVSEVATVLQSLGMQKAAKELGALRKEILGFERTITDNISKPLTTNLRSQVSEFRTQQLKLDSMSSQKAEVIAKSAKACASLHDQQAELEKQIRNFHRKAEERTDLPKRLDDAKDALQKETALAGKSEAWKAFEENEKKSKSLAKALRNDRSTITELKETIHSVNGYRLKAIQKVKDFLAEGCKRKFEKIAKESAQLQEKKNLHQEARERCAMQCEDLRVQYFRIEEQGRDSLRTSLARATRIRETAGQKKDLTESVSIRKTEVAARSAEVAYAGWWKSQLEIELRQLQQRIADSSPEVVEGNINNLHESIRKFVDDTTETIQKEKTSLLKQEVYFHKRDNYAKRTVAFQKRQFFDTQWHETQVAEREIELENLVAGDIQVQAAKERQVALLKQELLRLISAGDDQQDRYKLQKELKELSQHTFRVESQMNYLEQLERMIAEVGI